MKRSPRCGNDIFSMKTFPYEKDNFFLEDLLLVVEIFVISCPNCLTNFNSISNCTQFLVLNYIKNSSAVSVQVFLTKTQL